MFNKRVITVLIFFQWILSPCTVTEKIFCVTAILGYSKIFCGEYLVVPVINPEYLRTNSLLHSRIANLELRPRRIEQLKLSNL